MLWNLDAGDDVFSLEGIERKRFPCMLNVNINIFLSTYMYA